MGGNEGGSLCDVLDELKDTAACWGEDAEDVEKSMSLIALPGKCYTRPCYPEPWMLEQGATKALPGQLAEKTKDQNKEHSMENEGHIIENNGEKGAASGNFFGCPIVFYCKSTI